MADSPKKKEKKYPLKSDGSPEMIEYRNKVNSGEIKKMGRPFLTAEEKAESRKKRKEYMETYRSKKRRKRRHYEDYLSYEEARERIQAEGIRTMAEYTTWHRMNHPAKMPQSPEDFYRRRGKWQGWGHFLGTNNPFPYVKKKSWRPYRDAKAYVHGKGFENVPAWTAFCKSGQCPDDIPHRPDIAYFKSGDWFSWREFLGPKCKVALGQALEVVNDKVLYVLQVPDAKNNKLFRIGVTVGGWSSIQEAVKKFNLKFVDAYAIEADFDWKSFVLRFGEPSWEGEGVYQIRNIHELNMALGQFFIPYRQSGT